MLTVDYDEEEGITVPYPSVFDNVRKNHGFVDLRGRPDLAASIKESAQSKALQGILIKLAQKNAPFFTLGCDLGVHEEEGRDLSSCHIAGGYLQIMDRDYSDRLPNDYLTLAYAITQELEDKAAAYNWIIRFVHKSVMFNLDDFSNIASSLWIWFYAAAATPKHAIELREILIHSLQDILGRIK